MSLVRKERGTTINSGKAAGAIALLSSLSLLAGCATESHRRRQLRVQLTTPVQQAPLTAQLKR